MNTTTVSTTDVWHEDVYGVLERYSEDGIVPDASFTPRNIATLWEACWEVWEENDAVNHAELGALMAAMKATYPWLPSAPSWARISDPEEE